MDWSIRAFLSPNKQTKHLLLILSPPLLLQVQASCASDLNIFSHTQHSLSIPLSFIPTAQISAVPLCNNLIIAAQPASKPKTRARFKPLITAQT